MSGARSVFSRPTYNWIAATFWLVLCVVSIPSGDYASTLAEFALSLVFITRAELFAEPSR